MGFHHETFHPCRCTRSRLGRSAMGRSTHVVAPVFGFASRAAPFQSQKYGYLLVVLLFGPLIG